MGFWSTVGKLALAGLEKVQEMNAEAEKEYKRNGGHSDKQLMQKYKEGNYADKAAARKRLEERGYGKKGK